MKYTNHTRPSVPNPASSTRNGCCAAVRTLAAALILAAGPALTGCARSPVPAARPLLEGPALTADAPDPSALRTPAQLPNWSAVDRAVAEGAIEHLVVATPLEAIGTRFRTYELLGPRDQPGELLIERAEVGLVLTIRLGRFGEPELEAAVLEAVQYRLRDTRP